MQDTNNINWGIIGLGNIAHQFCRDLLLVDDAVIYAVASRSQEKANTFGEQYGVTNCYDSYDAILKDDHVDIIYIATPHNSHAELSVKAMTHGKHVLCEKPIALNKAEANMMIETSKETGQFFMEAFWTRFNPSVVEALLKIKNGDLGAIKYINADFAFYVDIPEGSRMTKTELGGGSLLDMGVYPLFLAYVVLGMPEKIMAAANFFESGADQQTSMILHYKGAQAVLHSSFMSPSNMVATISGTEGRINLHSVWHETQGYSMIRNNHKVDYHLPTKGKGFTYEIEACHKCIRNNQIESDVWSHQDSLNLMSITDAVRKETGLKFPQENKIK
ncbi:Gfo/Idh/MocA family oxidoreductase [Seonamhaeicola sp.]|uniref:Gfo/Idh/MocA family protein n=1 Tax=Seonamhaeicola sp. TaxID=1912245 RepID=UPI00260C593A|nr:Gfo/Idh/MocA family oxidoreductase [Seonamhaeicola sp.]